MARRIRRRRRARTVIVRARNPMFLGIEMEDVAFATGGLSGTALIDDKIVAPLIDRFVPSLQNSAPVRKAVDAFTTLITAYGLGFLTDHVNPRWGSMMQFGGFILGGSRLLTAVIPNYQLSSSTPVDSRLASLLGGAAVVKAQANVSAPSQLPSAGGSSGGGASDSWTNDVSSVGGAAYSFKGGA